MNQKSPNAELIHGPGQEALPRALSGTASLARHADSRS
jgi:hypothetical protein